MSRQPVPESESVRFSPLNYPSRAETPPAGNRSLLPERVKSLVIAGAVRSNDSREGGRVSVSTLYDVCGSCDWPRSRRSFLLFVTVCPNPFFWGSVCEAEPRREAATGQKGGGRATERYASSCDYDTPGVQNQTTQRGQGRQRGSPAHVSCACTLLHTK